MNTVIPVLLWISIGHSSLFSTATSINNEILQRYRRQSPCKPSEFKCSNGDCTATFNLCDGAKDCSDGSDETSAVCQSNRCPPLSFQCSYGACIDRELKCDGKSDCADGSDEKCGGGTSSPCGPGKFQCSSGQCIDQYSICDGVKDCSDGSDETRELCRNIICPSNSFQCNYGACQDRSVKCNGQSDCADGSDEIGCPVTGAPPVVDTNTSTTSITDCKLPPHPEHGAYFSALCQPGDLRQACRNSPGTRVPHNWLLKYTCSENYDLTSTDSEYSVCDNGIWKNPLNCIKLCSPLKSLSVDVRCVYSGREVPCERPMKPGTRATAKCKQHYKETFRPEYSSLLCQENGDWSYPLFYCTPDCGVSVKVQTLILHGKESHQGEFPWLTALYLRNASNKWEQKCAGTLISPHLVLTDCGLSPKVEATNIDKVQPLVKGGVPARPGEFPWLSAIFLKNQSDFWEQRCGGTLISSHIVMTAAHCLVLADGLVTTKNIKVGLGKYHRNYYLKEDRSLIADVKEIVVPRYYTGGDSFYALDIGLLDLAVSVQVTAYIMPACVDWTSTITINPGEIGHVAGWGTTENNTSSETVLSAQLSYIDNASCIKKVRQVYRRLVTHDKFCAGSYNGSQVDKGDSGGGMTIVRNGQHFVFGVVSTKIVEERQFSLFTDVANAEHHNWLEEHRTRLNQLHVET